MIKLGKVYSNLMVDVRATNEKLVQRARRIVKQATGAGEDIIDKVLEETEFNVKLAIVMILTGLRKDEAEKLLEKNQGHIRKAIDAVV
jgi:N-acetylmuramic acid 6-phosphate etherase